MLILRTNDDNVGARLSPSYRADIRVLSILVASACKLLQLASNEEHLGKPFLPRGGAFKVLPSLWETLVSIVRTLFPVPLKCLSIKTPVFVLGLGSVWDTVG